jgi:hypothetical protein
MANTTCPNDAIPDIINLPVPQNINVFVTPGTDPSYLPMQVCCEPSQVQVANSCWLWCEIPRSYFNGTDPNGAAEKMSSCFGVIGRNISDFRRSSSHQMNTAAGRVGMCSAKEIGLWVLALSGLVYML